MPRLDRALRRLARRARPRVWVAAAGAAPTLNSFTLNGDSSTASAAPGAAMTLAWNVSGATDVQLTTGTDYAWSGWPASGTATVTAQGSRNFFLRARNGGSAWQTFAAVHSIITPTTSAPSLAGTGRWDNYAGHATSASSIGAPSDGGAAYTVSGTWGITGGKAYNADGGVMRVALLASTFSDVVASVRLSTKGAGRPGLVIRATDASNYWAFASDSPPTLWQVVAGVKTGRASCPSFHDGDLITLAADGNVYTCYVNNRFAFTYTDAGNFNLTATSHGLYADGAADARFGGFAALDRAKALSAELQVPDFTANATTQTTKSGNWSDPTVWSGGSVPGASDCAWVLNAHAVTMDAFSDAPVNGVRVRPGGSLKFSTSAKVRLTACHVVVDADDGTHGPGYLEMGTAAAPVNPSRVPDQTACLALAKAPYADADVALWGSGLYVFGKFRSCGAAATPFARCAAAPQAGDRSVTLASAVTGWAQGDRLLLPDSHGLVSTDRISGGGTASASQAEALMLSSVSADGKTLAVAAFDGTGLKNAHPGSTKPNDLVNSEYLPHCVNMSRWASVRTTDPTDTDRAHVLVTGRADFDARYTTFHSTGRACPRPGRALQFRLLRGPTPAARAAGALAYDAAVDPAEFNPADPACILSNNGTKLNGPTARLVGCSVMDPFPVPNLQQCSAQWGVVMDEASWCLVKDNVVVNWGGGGVVVHDGSEQANVLDGNYVSLCRGSSDRFDFDGNNAGTADGSFGHPDQQGEGVGVWCRNHSQLTRNNVISDVRNWLKNGQNASYGVGMTPLVNTAGTPLGNFTTSPNYQGADPYSGVAADSFSYSPTNVPVLGCHDNEAYACLSGMTIWYVQFNGDPPYGSVPSGGTVGKYVVWNYVEIGVFTYPSVHLTFSDWVLRGPADQATADWAGFGVYHDDYQQGAITYNNFDVQGCAIGLLLPKSGAGDCYYNNFHFCNLTNVQQLDLYRNGNGAWCSYAKGSSTYAQAHHLVSATYETVPGQPLVTIYKQYPPGDGPWPATGDLSTQVVGALVQLFVVNHKGVAGDNFQVFFTQQLDTHLIPQTNSPGGGSPYFFACPEAGLTNQQSHDKYNLDGTLKAGWPDNTTPGICTCGEILVTGSGYSTRTDILDGYVK